MIRRLLLPLVAVITIIAMLVPGCTPTEYALTMAANPTAGGTSTDVTDSSPYASGTIVNIQATAASGYQFSHWSAPAGTFGGANDPTTTFTMPSQDVTVTANFVPVYDLSMLVNPSAGGTATDVTNSSPYTSGTVVNIQATAASGYQFSHWSAPAGTFDDASAATTTYTMPAQDVIVTASFQSTSAPTYTLTMAVDPAGSGTATDVTGASPYAAGAFVTILATADAGYVFSHWSAPAGTFDDASAATTTFTMPAQHVTVFAHFAPLPPPPLDHFTVYDVDWETAPPSIDEDVYLEDQFGAVTATVLDALSFCSPAQKVHDEVTTPIFNPDHHLTIYRIDPEDEPQVWQVLIENQFGVQDLTVFGPVALAVPTQKEGHPMPEGLDHYLIYHVKDVIESPYIGATVEVLDQFGDPVDVIVHSAVFLANPVRKTHGDEVTEILNPDDHIVIYWTDLGPFNEEVTVSNQFHEDQEFDIFGPTGLAVPSEKLSFSPVLDHFKCYSADTTTEHIEATVYLQDQFFPDGLEALIAFEWWFCNPALKIHEGTESIIWNPDHHLTVYHIIHDGPPGPWTVGVHNQFGTQHLTVWGPVALAVPTQKIPHLMPEGLDHYLIYEIVGYEGPTIDTLVGLGDQWSFDGEVQVTAPLFFANPTKKIHDEDVFEIVNPDAHLVFYGISPPPIVLYDVCIINQFGEQVLIAYDPALLATPSWKLYVDEMD